MVYAVGLPLEGSSEASDAVLAGLAAAGEPHDTRSAAAKGVSWQGGVTRRGCYSR